jgi:hypothetical protein
MDDCVATLIVAAGTASHLENERFDPTPIHTHAFPSEQADSAVGYAEYQTGIADEVVVKMG